MFSDPLRRRHPHLQRARLIACRFSLTDNRFVKPSFRVDIHSFNSASTPIHPAMLSRQAIRSIRAAAPQRTLARIPARSFAAAAPTTTQYVKPPVAVFGLDGTYATALYTAAVKSSALEPTAKALNALHELYNKDAKLAAVLNTPTLTIADKNAIVAELQKSLGAANANETVKNFLATLAENNRLGILEGVCQKFAEIMSASRGEVEMVVTSAQQLDNKTLSRLENAVSKSSYVGQGKKLKVTNQVNPDIVGGLVVEIGDRTIDLSVSARIAKMNKLLTDTL
ncbi:putative oligomycin sensitivity conferring protein [Whalleya microplaca]|nr:putative oligomycin sensitivity conferring protein [Whalleya microplaca]